VENCSPLTKRDDSENFVLVHVFEEPPNATQKLVKRRRVLKAIDIAAVLLTGTVIDLFLLLTILIATERAMFLSID
jgi:hypothetical protein